MSDKNRRSRLREEKLKKTKRLIYTLISIACLCIVILLYINLKPSTSDQDQLTNNNVNQDENNENTFNNENNNVENNSEEDNENNNDDSENDNETNNSFSIKDSDTSSVIKVIEGGEKDNVIRTFVADWEPIGTVQDREDHYTIFDEGSDDRIEIRKAILEVTEINEDMLVEYWIGNDGHNKVFSVIEDKETNEIYQLYLSWVDNKGWKMTKVELVKDSEYVK